MKNYIELNPVKKLKLLNDHSLFMGAEWTHLDQTRWCLHCDSQFSGASVRVWSDDRGGLWLECGTPGCDGSPIDWANEPWWRDDKKPTRKKAKTKKR